MRIYINARRALGDCLYFLLVLKKIRDKFPEAEITLVAWDSVCDIFSRSGLTDRCFNNSEYLQLPKADISRLTKENDIYIDLQTTSESAIGIKRSDSEVKVAVFLPAEKIQYEDFYTHHLRWESGEHVRTYLLRGFHEVIGTDPEPEDIPIPRPERLVRKVEIVFRDLRLGQGEFLSAIHPGAKEAARRWSPDNWAKVADWLFMFRGSRVLLLGSELKAWGGAEIRDLQDNARICRLANRKPTNLTGSTPSPLFLAEVMRQLGLYIGLDTGPTHLAAAVGVATLGIYLYRSAEHFNAWKLATPNTRIIARDNLEKLTVEELTHEVRLLLGLG